jgi:hypothetical protein
VVLLAVSPVVVVPLAPEVGTAVLLASVELDAVTSLALLVDAPSVEAALPVLLASLPFVSVPPLLSPQARRREANRTGERRCTPGG